MAPQSTTPEASTTPTSPASGSVSTTTAAAAAALASDTDDGLPELQTAHCHILYPEHVRSLIASIAADGPGNLQIITDFDYTLTRQYKPDGSRMPSSFCLLNMCPSLPAECRAESLRLVQRFRPIEIDPQLSNETKTAAMLEWWRLSSALHRGFRLLRSEIAAAAQTFQEPDCLRSGTRELFGALRDADVPVLVLSAGLGDSAQAILEATGVCHANVQVLGNRLLYGDDEWLEGFDERRKIHAFNKNEHALEDSDPDGYRRVHDRGNALVMGDSLGDAEMASGCAESGSVLKIGFLYEHVSEEVCGKSFAGLFYERAIFFQVEANLPAYMERFDIVLVDDQTMDVPRAILARICEQQSPTAE